MTLDPKLSWWLNFILFALTSAAGLAWNQYLDPKTAAIMLLALSYISNLLNFAIHGSVPGIASQVNTIGKMVVLFMVMWLVLFAQPSRAADLLPVKAPVASFADRSAPCTLTSCSGWYAGVGLSGNGGNADIIGNGINGSVFATGGILDLHGGYQLWNGQWFGAVEAGIGYSYTNGGVPDGSKLVGYEIVKLGYGFSGLLNPSSGTATGSQAPVPISIPASIASALISPYLAFGGVQHHGVSVWANGAGAEFLLASHWNLDLRYLYAAAQQGLSATQLVTLGVNYHF